VNRREFLKTGLGALFGGLLAKLGLAKAEELETIHVKFTESEEVFRYTWNPAAFVELGLTWRISRRSSSRDSMTIRLRTEKAGKLYYGLVNG
jgi:hypothetical protein